MRMTLLTILNCALIFPFTSVLADQAGERADDAVVLRYDSVYTPTHLVYQTALNILGDLGDELGSEAVYWQLNYVYDAAGAQILPPRDEVPFDLDVATRVYNSLMASRASALSEVDQMTRDLLCPNDRARPMGDAAHVAFDSHRSHEEEIYAAKYREFRSSFSSEIVGRIDNWLEELKSGYQEVRVDSRQAFANAGLDFDQHALMYCMHFDERMNEQ